MSDTFTAVISAGELVVAGHREPMGSLAARALNLPKTTVQALEQLRRSKDDPEAADRMKKIAASVELFGIAAEHPPVTDLDSLLDDLVCFRVYVRRLLSQEPGGSGAEDYARFTAELENLSTQLRREDNLRRTVLSTNISPCVDHIAENGRLCRRLRFDSLRELLLYDLLCAMENSHTPRPCLCCGCFFVPTRTGEVYCTGVAPHTFGKTCREVGARRKFAEKLSGNEILRLYRAACGRVYTRKSRGSITADDAAGMIHRCTQLRDQALGGEISIDELGEQLTAATRSGK